MACSVFLFGFLTGCGGTNMNGSTGKKVDSPKQEEVHSNFHPSIETREENNTIFVNYKVKNKTEKSQKLTFPSGLQADFILYDENGNKVKQYSDEVMATQAIVEVALEQEQEIEQEFTINNLANGKYVLEVFLTAKEEPATIKIGLVVENSTAAAGKGELVGQVDSHTVEIMIEGIPTSFQLADKAKEQLIFFKKGESLSFIYSTNEFEQKIIEEFVIE